MHADLEKLLDLQAKDAAIADIDRRLTGLEEEVGALDAAVQRAAGRARRRPRAAAEGRAGGTSSRPRSRATASSRSGGGSGSSTVRNPKEASHAHGRARPGPLGDGQGGERVGPERRGRHRARAQGRRGGDQGGRGRARAGARAGAARGAAARRSRPSARRRVREREASAGADRQAAPDPLRPAAALARDATSSCRCVGGACGACYTAVPLNRRSQIRSGAVLDGCEACGVILYPAEPAGSA